MTVPKEITDILSEFRPTGSGNHALDFTPDMGRRMPDGQQAPELMSASPEREVLAEDKKVKFRPRRLSWRRIRFWSKTAVAILAGLPAAVIAAFLLGSLAVLTFHRHSLDLDAISVPETLSKAGFTKEIATRHLRDAIYAVRQRANTNMRMTGIDIDQDLSAVTIPKTGLSLQNVAVGVRSHLP